MNTKSSLLLLAFCLGLQTATFSAHASDLSWSQWRGPTRDGMIKDGAPWPKSIAKKKLKLSWRKEIAKGYPGPVVSENLVFTVETKGKNEIVRAFDRTSGEQKWENQWPGSMSVPFFAWKNGSWVRSTPAYDGKNLYVGGMRDFLVCLDAESGKKKWEVDFMKRYKAALPAFGFVCSPMIEGDHLYVQAGAGFVKLDKETGKSVWRALNDKGGMYGSAFSSPTMAKLGGIEQVVVLTRTDMTGVEPENGKVLWKKPIKAFRGMNILTPTIFGNSVFTSSYGGKSLLFDLAKDADGFSIKQKWENKQEGYMSGPIVIGDHCYIHLRKQRMTCLDMKSGETKWISSESFGKYMSMVSNGKEILALDEDGTLYLIEPDSEKLFIKEKRTISKSPSWAHLAVAGNQLFVRELEAIACYEW
jgi:outer membrane protein assembly factor BamB